MLTGFLRRYRAFSSPPTRIHAPDTTAIATGYRKLRIETLEDRQLLSVSPLGLEFQVNAYTTNRQIAPAVAVDNDGDFVIAWESNQDGDGYGVYAQRYGANSTPQGSEFRVNSYTTGRQGSPAVASDATGNFVVAWESLGQDGAAEGVYAQRFSAGGVAQGNEFRVSAVTAGGQSQPAVAMDDAGNFVIVWQHDAQSVASWEIYAQRYSADGLLQGSAFRVNTYTSNPQQFATVAADADGDFVVAWESSGQDASSTYGIYAQRFSATGAVGSEFRVNAFTTNHQRFPSAAMDASGALVIAWMSVTQDGSDWGVFARSYDSTGNSSITEFQVNAYTLDDQQYPSVAMDAQGNFVVAWDVDSSNGLYGGLFAQRFNASAVKQGSEFQVHFDTGNDERYAAVAMSASGDFVAAWMDIGTGNTAEGIFARIFDESTDTAGPIVSNVYAANAAGVANSNPIAQGDRVSTAIPKIVVVFSENMATTGMANVTSAHHWRLARNGVDVKSQISGITFGFNATTNRYEAVLSFSADLSNGSYELTARSGLEDLSGNRLDGDLDGSGFGEDYVHRFSMAQPVAAGSEFRVSTQTVGPQQTSQETPRAVAMDPAGNFVVTWTGEAQDSSGYNVYAQRFNFAGVAQGSEFRVNTYTTQRQLYSTVATDSAGNFVVAWTSEAQDGSSWGIFAQRYNSAGTAMGSEFRVNSYTTSNQRGSTVAMDPQGNFVITWNASNQDGSLYGIYARRFDAAGTALGTDFRINSFTTDQQRFPSVASDANGNFVVTWSSYLQDGSDWGVYAQRYSSTGTPLGNEFRVNSYTTGRQRYSNIAMDADGDFVVVWGSDGQDGSGYGIFAQRYDAMGTPRGSEFRVNNYTSLAQANPGIASAPDGDFVISWSSSQDTAIGIYALRFDAAGVPQGSEFHVNTYTPNRQWLSNVAVDGDGDLVIVWSSDEQDGSEYGVYAQRFANSSVVGELRVAGDITAISPGERLASVVPGGPSLTVSFSHDMSQVGGAAGANSVTNPANWMLSQNGVDISGQITSVGYSGTTATLTLSNTLGNGDYVLTAKSTIQDADGRALDGDEDGTLGGNYARAFSIQQSVATGSETRVNSFTTGGQGAGKRIAMDASGDYVIVWSSDGQDGSGFGIYAQRFNAQGIAAGSEFRVNAYTTGHQQDPAVAMGSVGDFLVTWESAAQDGDGYGVYAQRFNAFGVPLGTEFRVNSYTTSNQRNPIADMDADGDLVVAWVSLGQDGSSDGVYAQRINASGTLLGSEFRVNSTTTNSQADPELAMDAAGEFVVVWRSSAQDGDGIGIYGQRFSAAGGLLGSEFRINSYTTGNQLNPTVGRSSAGDFVVAWENRETQDGDGYGVFAQRFSAAGATLGSEFRVATSTLGNQGSPIAAMDGDGDFVVVWSGSGASDSSGVYARRYSGAGAALGAELMVNTYTIGTQNGGVVAVDDDGDFVVAWKSTAQDGDQDGVFMQRYAGAPPLQIAAMTPTYTGFAIEFNRDFDASLINLYDQGGVLGATDVTLTGSSTGAVRGTVVIEPGSRKLTFIKSGGPLAADTYTISLRSDTVGFKDSGHLLDGNGDGFASDNFTAKFTIAAPPAGVTLAIGDFARGYSQAVNLPASSSSGIPITISNAVGVKSASFALVYDPALLTISGATLGAGITGAVSLDTSQAGMARITVTSGTQLSSTAGLQPLVNLTASVPSGAPYASKQILELSNLQLTDTSLAAIPAIDDDGVHIAAYFGDANGSQAYNSPDATLAQRIIVGTNTGLSAYQLADPYLIVDITGNGAVQSNDITLIQRAIVGTATTQIPAHPGLGLVASGGPDPIVSIPKNLEASVGGTISVPVELLVTEPDGITLAGADLAIAYDATKFTLTDAQVGTLFFGFGLSVNLSTPGLVRLSIASGEPLELSHDATGTLAMLHFTTVAGAGTLSSINLLNSSAALQTALYDSSGRSLTLSPAPTDEADNAVDGLVTILSETLVPANVRNALVDSAMCSEDLSY